MITKLEKTASLVTLKNNPDRNDWGCCVFKIKLYCLPVKRYVRLFLSMMLITSCSPSPTPTTSNENVLGQVVLDRPTTFRFVDNKLERLSKDNIYYKEDLRQKEAFGSIRVKAYESFRQFSQQLKSEKFVADKVVLSNFPKEISRYSIDQVEGSLSLWGAKFKNDSNLRLLLATELDDEYMAGKGREFVTSLDNFNQIKSINAQFGFPWITGEVRSSRSQENFRSTMLLATNSFAKTEQMETGWIQVPAHESFHVVFDYYMSQKPIQSEGEYLERAPQHLIEGAANYYGYSYAMPNLGWYSDALDISLIQIWNSLNGWKSVNSKEDVVELLYATERSTPQAAFDASYAVGSLFAEWIVGNFGIESFIKIVQNVSLGYSFNENLKQSLGIEKDVAYKKSASYILNIFRRLGLN